MDEIIHVDSDAVESVLNEFDKSTAGFDKAATSMTNDFTAATSKNLYRNGVRKINEQINLVNGHMKRYKSTIKKYTDQYFFYDDLAAKRIDELTIPKSFDINDSIEENIFDKVKLNKEDGLSVNNGDESATTITDNGFLYQNVLGENLGNINNENIQEEKMADDIVGIEKENVDNIKNENRQEEQAYDDRSNIYSNVLNRMDPKVSVSFEDYLADIMENQFFDDDEFVVKKGE